jgi:hypothetical protein
MEIDIKALDERIKAYQLIQQKLASDPELAIWVRALVGNGVVSPVPAQTTPKASTDESARDAAIAKLKGVRLEVFKRVPESGDVGKTAKEITERLSHAGHKWGSDDHVLTVKEQLRELLWAKLVEKAGTQKDGSALWRRCV